MAERVDTGGLATVLQLLGARGAAVAGADGQPDLFEADAPLPLPPAKQPDRDPGKAGRPAGVRNRSTDEWVRFFLGQNRSPLSVLGNIISQPLGDLVDQLQAMSDKHKGWKPGSETRDGYWERIQINPLEVLKLQQAAAVALLPYIHRKQPMAIEVEQKQRGVVLIGDLEVSDVSGDDDLALPLPPPQSDQQVSEPLPAQSHAEKSHASPLTSNFNGIGPDDI